MHEPIRCYECGRVFDIGERCPECGSYDVDTIAGPPSMRDYYENDDDDNDDIDEEEEYEELCEDIEVDDEEFDEDLEEDAEDDR